MWHAVWYWTEHFLPNFAQNGYPSLALSLRGRGASEGIERLRRTSVTDYVVDVAQVDSHLETPSVQVGHRRVLHHERPASRTC